MERAAKILSVLTYPFLMPFYAFTVFYGTERQAYYYSVWSSVYYYFFVLLLVVLIPSYVMYIAKIKDVFSGESPLRSKILITAAMIGSYILGFYVMRNENFSSHGVLSIFQLFAILSAISLLDFNKFHLHPYGLFCGGLSSFVVLIGKISGADVFWTFVVTVLVFSICAFARMHIEKIPFTRLLIGYVTGFLCGNMLMLFY